MVIKDSIKTGLDYFNYDLLSNKLLSYRGVYQEQVKAVTVIKNGMGSLLKPLFKFDKYAHRNILYPKVNSGAKEVLRTILERSGMTNPNFHSDQLNGQDILFPICFVKDEDLLLTNNESNSNKRKTKNRRIKALVDNGYLLAIHRGFQGYDWKNQKEVNKKTNTVFIPFPSLFIWEFNPEFKNLYQATIDETLKDNLLKEFINEFYWKLVSPKNRTCIPENLINAKGDTNKHAIPSVIEQLKISFKLYLKHYESWERTSLYNDH